ncbi:MAG: prepilin-type N-terminal cleavage/methylation domain-containing protein [Planctomycetota bacterium]
MEHAAKHATSRDRHPGFTLIELVVVLVLIGLLLTFSPLALDAVIAERELEKEASRYGTTIELISRQAVLDRTPYAIHIDTDNHRWATQLPDEITQTVGEDEDARPQTLLFLDLELDPEELDWRQLPDGMTLSYYEGSRRIEQGRYRILVNPTGTIDPHSIVFESNSVSSLDERDRMRTVKVNFPGFVSFALGREIEDFKKSAGELGR